MLKFFRVKLGVACDQDFFQLVAIKPSVAIFVVELKRFSQPQCFVHVFCELLLDKVDAVL